MTTIQATALLDVALTYASAQHELTVANSTYVAACEAANKMTRVHDGMALALTAEPMIPGGRSIFEAKLYDAVRVAAQKAASAEFALQAAANAYGESIFGWQTKPDGVEI